MTTLRSTLDADTVVELLEGIDAKLKNLLEEVPIEEWRLVADSSYRVSEILQEAVTNLKSLVVAALMSAETKSSRGAIARIKATLNKEGFQARVPSPVATAGSATLSESLGESVRHLSAVLGAVQGIDSSLRFIQQLITADDIKLPSRTRHKIREAASWLKDLVVHTLESAANGMVNDAYSIIYQATGIHEILSSNPATRHLDFARTLDIDLERKIDRSAPSPQTPEETSEHLLDCREPVATFNDMDEGGKSGDKLGGARRGRKPQSYREVESEGKKYISLLAAAKQLHVTRGTVHKWATKRVLADGTVLDVIQDKVSKHHFISVDSVERLANRFTGGDKTDARHSLKLNVSTPKPVRQPKVAGKATGPVERA